MLDNLDPAAIEQARKIIRANVYTVLAEIIALWYADFSDQIENNGMLFAPMRCDREPTAKDLYPGFGDQPVQPKFQGDESWTEFNFELLRSLYKVPLIDPRVLFFQSIYRGATEYWQRWYGDNRNAVDEVLDRAEMGLQMRTIKFAASDGTKVNFFDYTSTQVSGGLNFGLEVMSQFLLLSFLDSEREESTNLSANSALRLARIKMSEQKRFTKERALYFRREQHCLYDRTQRHGLSEGELVSYGFGDEDVIDCPAAVLLPTDSAVRQALANNKIFDASKTVVEAFYDRAKSAFYDGVNNWYRNTTPEQRRQQIPADSILALEDGMVPLA